MFLPLEEQLEPEVSVNSNPIICGRHAVCWYVMACPTIGRNMAEKLEWKLALRQRYGRPSFKYTSFVEVKKVNGRFVNIFRMLSYNCLFASILWRGIYKIKQLSSQYNFFPMIRCSEASCRYPYLDIKPGMICNGLCACIQSWCPYMHSIPFSSQGRWNQYYEKSVYPTLERQ